MDMDWITSLVDELEKSSFYWNDERQLKGSLIQAVQTGLKTGTYSESER